MSIEPIGALIARFVRYRLSRIYGVAKLTVIVGLLLIFAVPQSAPAPRAPQVGTEALACADKSIVASAVRTPLDAQTLTRCAYEFVQEAGFEEARRAFNEDVRWKSGPIYVFVSEVTPLSDQAQLFVFPPDQAREGTSLGLLIDAFGNDYYKEQHRIASEFGEGWIYYSFSNPATGRDEPKATYIKSIDWKGNTAAIGVGVYLRDLPGTCRNDEVNAALLDSVPSETRLQEFVRCAAMELESQGYFATRALSGDPRWRNGSIYLFGLDTYGNTLFSGDPVSGGYGIIAPELNNDLDGPFGGRDVVSLGDAFGETFLYYSRLNPATGMVQRKATFVKRVVSYGLPILVGSGYYLGTEPQSLPEPNAQSVWSYLESAPYTDWTLFPGTSRFQPGRSPHGALLITYVNDTARTALTRRTGPFPPGPLPDGSIIVKENYTPDRTLDAVTVMYKRAGYNPEHGDWYWLKRAANGNVDAEGMVVGCQNCHSAAARDYVLTEVQ